MLGSERRKPLHVHDNRLHPRRHSGFLGCLVRHDGVLLIMHRYLTRAAAQAAADAFTASTGIPHMVCNNRLKGGFTVRSQPELDRLAAVRQAFKDMQ